MSVLVEIFYFVVKLSEMAYAIYSSWSNSKFDKGYIFGICIKSRTFFPKKNSKMCLEKWIFLYVIVFYFVGLYKIDTKSWTVWPMFKDTDVCL